MAETSAGKPDAAILENLFRTIESRRGDDPKTSYTAKLMARGLEKMCEKLGEEAFEVVVAALRQGPDRVAEESADLLYHLLVIWSESGVEPADVWAALEGRVGTSGLDEKKARKKKKKAKRKD
jgi:phosphoribosyl-ATP pyrophosphohydrolase